MCIMEQISNTPELETELIKAGFLEKGDNILLGGIEFEVVDADSQHERGRIKIKNNIGEISEIDAFSEVEKIKVNLE